MHFKDNKKPVVCPVDNFPADNPAYIKRDGFRCNDVSLLDRLSFSSNFDSDIARIVASRIHEMRVPDGNDNLTDEQKLILLRPAKFQTASEIKAWDEHVYQFMSTSTAGIDFNDVKVENETSDVVNATDVNIEASENV